MSLGTAVVVTIYATGFARTRSAAARIDAADRSRVTIPLPAVAAVRSGSADTGAAANFAGTDPSALGLPKVASKVKKSSSPKRATTSPLQPTPSAERAALPTKPDLVEPPPSATPTPVPSPPPVSAPAAPTYKDGTFSGWGTSRHGDIEATVIIKDGRIASAVISQCYTRYPCSRVEHLQGQVVERQSAEVDYVSRATDSANAFYYAVVAALKLASR